MVVYDRDSPDDLTVAARWDGGFTWIAHPDETGRRASHAVSTPDGDGVWVVDPIDAGGLDDRLAKLGSVRGVVVLSNYHARDAGRVADRHGVPVSVPPWIDRVPERVAAPVERREAFAGFRTTPSEPLFWQEAIAYREADRTLVVVESMGTAPQYTVGAERLGVTLVRRLRPPRDRLADVRPERILVGHGAPILEDATAALRDALDGARRRFPRALLAHLPTQVRSGLAAVRE